MPRPSQGRAFLTVEHAGFGGPPVPLLHETRLLLDVVGNSATCAPSRSEIVLTRTVWGDSLPSPTTTNHRGQPYRIYDGAGELTHVAYDFKGNLLSQQRRIAVTFETTQDWSLLDAATPPTPANIATLADSELDAEVFSTAFVYDALNRVTSSTTPDDSETLSTYNEAGLLETVATPTTFVSDLDYDAKGQRLRCVHGNGTVTSYEYDPRTFRLARLRLVRDADSAVLQDLRYTYDPVGNITQIRDAAQQTVYFDNAVVSPDQRFEYDPPYRLVHAEGREHTSLSQPTHADLSFGPQPHPNDPSALRAYEEDYAWDEVGNLLQLQHAASGGNFTRQYVYANANNLSPAGNRLLSNSAPGESTAPFSHSYTYDAHGNMTSMPHLAAMAWDHADRLHHCDLGGGGDVWFVYDAAGNRVRKVQVNTSGSTVRERVYVGAWEVWRERTGTPLAVEQERQTLHVGDDRGKLALVETLTVDDGDPVATPTSIQRHQHGNHLGSASLELDADAAVISYEEFHPFGTSSYAANDSGIEVSAKRYRYIAKERDEETGLYHLGARYYASWLGRWTAADPIGLGDGINRFAYSRGSPIRLRDRGGRKADGGLLGDLLERQGALVVSLANAGSPADREQIAEELDDVAQEVASEVGRVRAEPSRRSAPQRDESFGMGSPLTAIRARGPAARTNVPGLGAFPHARGGGETRSLLVDAGGVGVNAIAVGHALLVAAPLAEGVTIASQAISAKGIAALDSASAAIVRTVGASPAARTALAALGDSKAVQFVAALGLAAGQAAATATGLNVPGVTTGIRAPRRGVNVREVLTKPESLWGRSADEIAAAFEEAGFGVAVRQSTRGSARAQIIEVSGHPEISQIQVHPGGGRHGGAYYKISTSTEGRIKVVDPETYKPSPDEKVRVVPFDGGSR